MKHKMYVREIATLYYGTFFDVTKLFYESFEIHKKNQQYFKLNTCTKSFKFLYVARFKSRSFEAEVFRRSNERNKALQPREREREREFKLL
jgi:hypothetical protein